MSCSERMSRKVEWVLWFLEKMNLCLHRCGNGEWEDHSESLIKPLRGVGTICRGMKYSALGWVEVGDHFHSFISQIIIEDLLGIICLVKHLPAIQETWVRFLGWEDSLEEGMTTHSSTLAGESLWTEEPDGYSPWGRKEFDMTERLSTVQGRCAINQNTSTVAFLLPWWTSPRAHPTPPADFIQLCLTQCNRLHQFSAAM